MFHSRKRVFGLLYCWNMNFMQRTKKCGLSPFFSEANTPVTESRHFTGESTLCSGGGNCHSSHWYRFKREMEYLTHRVAHSAALLGSLMVCVILEDSGGKKRCQDGRSGV